MNFRRPRLPVSAQNGWQGDENVLPMAMVVDVSSLSSKTKTRRHQVPHVLQNSKAQLITTVAVFLLLMVTISQKAASSPPPLENLELTEWKLPLNHPWKDEHLQAVSDICSHRQVVNATTTSDSWTIVMTINDGFYPFFQNWFAHYQKLDLNYLNMVLFAEDYQVYQKLQQRQNEFSNNNTPNNSRIQIILGSSQQNQQSKSFDANSQEYIDLISKRPSRLLQVLCTGQKLIYVDSDTVWLLNPLLHLYDSHVADISIAVDVQNVPKTIATHQQEFCTGFMAIQASMKSLLLLQKWEAECRHGRGMEADNDQAALNRVYSRLLKSNNNNNQLATLKGLPQTKFPNGADYFKKFTKEQRQQAVQVHANFLKGSVRKKEKLLEHGLWLV